MLASASRSRLIEGTHSYRGNKEEEERKRDREPTTHARTHTHTHTQHSHVSQQPFHIVYQRHSKGLGLTFLIPESDLPLAWHQATSQVQRLPHLHSSSLPLSLPLLPSCPLRLHLPFLRCREEAAGKEEEEEEEEVVVQGLFLRLQTCRCLASGLAEEAVVLGRSQPLPLLHSLHP